MAAYFRTSMLPLLLLLSYMLPRLSALVPHLTRRTMSTASIPTTHLACQIASQGPLEVIPSALSSIPVPRAGPGEVLYKVEYAGVNFIDTYQRGGVYVLPMPHVLGNESAGVVVEVGEGVQGLAVGDRVAVS